MRRTALALAVYLALGGGLSAALLWPRIEEKRPWRPNADERMILEAARAWPEGGGAAGLLASARRGIELEGRFRPAHSVLWALLYRKWGDELRPYALISVLANLAAGAALFFLVREALGDREAALGPAAAALFLTAHPFAWDTVYWPAYQQELLHAPLYLGALALLMRWDAGGGRRAYAGALALAALAATAKEFIATLPLVALVWIALMRSPKAAFGRVPALLPFLAVGAAPHLARWLVLRGQEAMPTADVWAPPGVGGAEYLRLLAAHLWGNLESPGTVAERVLFWLPWRTLSWDGRPWAFAGALALIAFAAGRTRTLRPPALAASLAWLYLLPAMHLMANPRDDAIARRWCYIPVAAGALLVAWGVEAAVSALRDARARRRAEIG